VRPPATPPHTTPFCAPYSIRRIAVMMPFHAIISCKT
jgi:hypothetical protein